MEYKNSFLIGINMKDKRLVLSTGFAMFSMFFGSGNLVFPLTVGKESEGHFLLASLGIIITGVLVPFIGVLAMCLFNGKTENFFGSMGKQATFWFSFIALSLMGPFGVLARCITVAHGSFRLLFPDLPLILFSLALCCLIYFITINKNRIIPLLGTFLTPFLLLALFLIYIFGYLFAPEIDVSSQSFFNWKAFKNGFLQGYFTMDLLAAFFFSTFVLQHLEKKTINCSSNEKWSLFIRSAGIGAGLLSAVYIALVYLGKTYATDLAQVPPEEMLGIVAQKAMGSFSAPIVCLAVVLACLTTAVVLASLFADFLRTNVSQNKLSIPFALLITLMIAFFVSTLEFAGIARFLSPILETVYPALIVLTALNICSQLWGFKQRRWPILVTIITKLFCF